MQQALIVADIEGIAGIYDLSDDSASVEMYTQELIVYIEALVSCGINKITVCDSHSDGDMLNRDLISETFEDKATISVVSKISGMSFGTKYDFALLVGYHGMEGAPGILPHTIRFDFKGIYVKDTERKIEIPIGEVELITRWLGSHGIPVILVTGDREAVYEANFFNPYRLTCCTKSLHQSLSFGENLVAKLISAVECALRLEKNLCISLDNQSIAVDFHNKDFAKLLGNQGYDLKDSKILFSSCADFVSKLYCLIESVDQLNIEAFNANVLILNKLKGAAENFTREDIEDSVIGTALQNNMYYLDSESRIKITEYLEKLGKMEREGRLL